MNRSALYAAIGALLVAPVAANAQVVGDAANGINNVVGAGLAVPGQVIGGIGTGLNGIGNGLGTGLGGVVGTGLAVPGDVLGGLGAGLGGLGGGLGGLGSGIGVGLPGVGGDGFRLANLQGAQYSIETSQLAVERARSPAVRQYAKLQLDQQISNAAALGAEPNSVPVRPEQQAMVQRLSQATGGRFDRAYIRDQINVQQQLLQLNMQAIHSPADPAVRRVATVAVPNIQTNLAILRRLQAGRGAV